MAPLPAVFVPFPGAAAPVMKLAVDRVLATIEAETKKWCPVDTGTLRRSYTSASHLRADPYGHVSTSITYAPFVEFGTSRMAAQPHLVKGAGAAVRKRQAKWVTKG